MGHGLCPTRVAVGMAALMLTGSVIAAQERVDDGMNWRIRQEAATTSQVLRTVHTLTDRYGPRLTGSPNLEAAGRWAIQQMEAWGLTNGRMEGFDFGHPGWSNERLSVHVVAPVMDALVVEALAWTPGTNGTIRAEVVTLLPPESATRETLDSYLDGVRDGVRGKVVLVGAHTTVGVSLNGAASRREDADLEREFNAPPPQPIGPGGGAGRGGGSDAPDRPLSAGEIEARVAAFLREAGAAARVNDAGRVHGQIQAFHNRTFDIDAVVPTVVMRNEDYGRISRLLRFGTDPVELELDIVNREHPDGVTAYNAIAELPGTDLADEVVMLGGHLDSWHAATGATDNAVGVAVMMEAARILASLEVQPRRTIRVALWGGEEQGLLGSKAYVERHFGTAENPTAAYDTFAGYFNIDAGTGRARGAQVFGPPEAGEILDAVFAPFRDLGVIGARTTTSRRSGESDHTSFNAAGLPGISMQQDPIQYFSYTWHSNLDTYERVLEQDAIASSISVAAAVYHLAMRDEQLPRFTPRDMPPSLTPPPGR
ncbi:MAG: M20/M25/M40 family metallo-hydrolase [Acidobacteria bacterium]|nr:M20/M25/M40 family metallo-hydrolase [Acidobacteriota bacterium]